MEIQIKTEQKISVFEIKKFEEEIDIDILNKLIQSDLLQTVKWTVGTIEFENEKQQLLMLRKLIKKNKLTTSYKRPKYQLGRVYPNKSLSLCSLRRQIRHTLAVDNYIDIDISNCHPEILNQLCIHHNIPTKYLNEYVINRAEILRDTIENYNCSRDDAKKLFISLMYFGSFNSWENGTNKAPTDFIYNFINELKIISNEFIKANPDIVKIVKALQKKNLPGSVLSIILQEKERIILETVYNSLVEKKVINNNDCVLCFDGIMVKKAKYYNKLLDELSDAVLSELKYKLQFVEKEFDDHYLDELKDIKYEEPSIFNDPDYLLLKDKFELNCFRLENPFSYVFISDDKDIQFFNNEKLRNWAMKDYSLKITDPNDDKIKKFFIDLWMSDPKQKTYNKIVFDPTLSDTNNYNYFTGFASTEGEPAEENNPFNNLLRRICNDKITYDFFVDWIAHIIQKPYKKTNTAIILYSNTKGIGKNCIVDGISKLLKGYSAHVETIEDITKNFNSHLVNKLFIYGDEIKATAKSISDKLKQVITRPTQNMERKGKDAFEIEDFTNWLFTTNNRDAFKVEQGDRRLFFVDCLNERLSMTDSTEYYKYIENPENINKLFNFFKNHKIIHNIGIEPPPSSRMKNELQFESKPAYIQMLYKNPYEIIDDKYTAQRLYEKSKAFATTNYLNHSYSIREFGLEIGKIFKNFKKRTNIGNVYEFNININEFSKILFEYDPEYYRFINNLEDDIIPTFTGTEQISRVDI
jgi:hypothetical protein